MQDVNMRDFKGVWIPKEIWFDERMTMLDKGILMEIDSLDNKDGCKASNEYLANFCGCSDSNVSKTITLLKNLGYIYQESFDGRTRVLRSNLGKLYDRQPNKKCEAASQNLQLDNNISKDILYNNLENNNYSKEKQRMVSKKGLLGDKLDKKPKKQKEDKQRAIIDNLKKSLFSKIGNIKIIELLGKWIEELYSKGKGIGSNALDIALEQLQSLSEEKQKEVIKKATLNGWRDFSYCVQNKNDDKHLNKEIITDEQERNQALDEIKTKIKSGGEKDVDYF